MGQVRVALAFPGSVHEAETLWYDTLRWPSWVDGLSEVASVTGAWPHVGAAVAWDSYPGGRGRVVEHVVAYAALDGQTVAVQDPSLEGRQSVRFTAAGAGVEVELTLEYALRQPSIFNRVADPLFIRRALARSLRTTLTRFGTALASTRRRRPAHG